MGGVNLVKKSPNPTVVDATSCPRDAWPKGVVRSRTKASGVPAAPLEYPGFSCVRAHCGGVTWTSTQIVGTKMEESKENKTNKDRRSGDDKGNVNKDNDEGKRIWETNVDEAMGFARSTKITRSPEMKAQDGSPGKGESRYHYDKDCGWKSISEESIPYSQELEIEDEEQATEMSSGDEVYGTPRDTNRTFPFPVLSQIMEQRKKTPEVVTPNQGIWEGEDEQVIQRAKLLAEEMEQDENKKRGWTEITPLSPSLLQQEKKKKIKEESTMKNTIKLIERLNSLVDTDYKTTAKPIKKVIKALRNAIMATEVTVMEEDNREKEMIEENNNRKIKKEVARQVETIRKELEEDKKRETERAKQQAQSYQEEIHKLQEQIRKLKENPESGRENQEEKQKRREEKISNKINKKDKNFDEFWKATKDEWSAKILAGIQIKKGNPIRDGTNTLIIHREGDKEDRGILKYIKDTFEGGANFVGRGSDNKSIKLIKITTESEEEGQLTIKEKRIYGLKLPNTQMEEEVWRDVYNTIEELLEKITKEDRKRLAVTCTDTEAKHKLAQLLLYLTGSSDLKPEIYTDKKAYKEQRGKDQEDIQKTQERKEKRKNQNTAAIVITKGEERTYAQMLKEVKSIKGEIIEEGIEVERVREGRNGDMIIVMSKGSQKIKELKTKMSQKFEGAKITTTGEEKKEIFFVEGMDAETREEDVQEALENMGVEKVATIANIRKAYGNTTKATIETNKEGATLLAEKEKIRIGLNMCAIKRRVQVVICHRCLGIGHYQATFKGPDRRGNCYKCGKVGHVASTCTEASRCITCEKEGHRTNTTACPEFRKVLAYRRRQEEKNMQ